MHLELAFETEVFLLSCLLGAGMGIVYNFLNVFRNTVYHHKVVIFIEDFIYALMFGFGYFTFCTGLTGSIRGFIIFGMLIGCILEMKTMGKAIVLLLTKVFDTVWRFTLGPIGGVLAKFFGMIHRRFVKKNLIFKKSEKNMKKPLKVE